MDTDNIKFNAWQWVVTIVAFFAFCGWSVMSMAQCSSDVAKANQVIRVEEIKKGIVRP